MWYIFEGFGRIEGQKTTTEKAQWLEAKRGGYTKDLHTPRDYKGIAGGNEFEGNVIAYISNKKPIYSYALVEIWADDKLICKVTRREDAIKIMHALKRDYKDIVVRLPND